MKITRLFMLVLPVVLLSACSNNYFGPFSIPSGYAYHGEVYKAPPGPELILTDDYEKPISFWSETDKVESVERSHIMDEGVLPDEPYYSKAYDNESYGMPVSLFAE